MGWFTRKARISMEELDAAGVSLVARAKGLPDFRLTLVDEEFSLCTICGWTRAGAGQLCPDDKVGVTRHRIGRFTPFDTPIHLMVKPGEGSVVAALEGDSAIGKSRFPAREGWFYHAELSGTDGEIVGGDPAAESVQQEGQLVHKLGIISMPGWIYSLDSDGDLCGTRMMRRGSMNLAMIPTQKIVRVGVKMTRGLLYSLGNDGHIRAVPA